MEVRVEEQATDMMSLLLDEVSVNYNKPVLFVETFSSEWIEVIEAPEIIIHITDPDDAFESLRGLEACGLDDKVQITTGSLRDNTKDWRKRFGLVYAAFNPPRGQKLLDYSTDLGECIRDVTTTSADLVLFGNYIDVIDIVGDLDGFRSFCLRCADIARGHLKRVMHDASYDGMHTTLDFRQAVEVEIGLTICNILLAKGRRIDDIWRDNTVIDLAADDPHKLAWLTEAYLRMFLQPVLGDMAHMRSTRQRFVYGSAGFAAVWYTTNKMYKQSMKTSKYYSPESVLLVDAVTTGG